MEKYNQAVEGMVLGTLLLYPEAIPRLMEILELQGENVFYDEDYGAVYQAIVELYEQGKPTDPTGVYLKLQEQKKNIARKLLADLVVQATGPDVAEHYARELKKLAIRREFNRLTAEASQKAEESIETGSLIDETITKLTELNRGLASETEPVTAKKTYRDPAS